MALAKTPTAGASRSFARYAWTVTAVNVAVIVWGAFVRATGSGAGCGRHWPTCRGEVIPLSGDVATFIEFAHRATSGLALALVLILVLWARRAFPAGHRVRRGAGWSLVFIVIEALVGAALVGFELVAENASPARAVVIALHLDNTLFLLAALSLTAWWAGGGPPWRLDRRRELVELGLGAGSLLLVGMSGAVTALGDTLFPARSLAEGLRADLSPTAHVLVSLRLWHPLLAVLAGAIVLTLALGPHRQGPARRAALWLSGAVILQLGLGAVNLLLLAPLGLQLAHLLAADAVWIAFVLFAASVLSAREAR